MSFAPVPNGQVPTLQQHEALPKAIKGFRIGYPLGHSIPTRNEAAQEVFLNWAYGLGLGKYPWAKNLRFLGSCRAESIRIDDNRNTLCDQFLDSITTVTRDDLPTRCPRCHETVDWRLPDAPEKLPECPVCDGPIIGSEGEVLVQTDRDELIPPDGILQLALTCTEHLPIVCGVYFQRSLETPYPHVYAHSHSGKDKWGEPAEFAHKLALHVCKWLEDMRIPDHYLRPGGDTAVRFAQPDGTPLPEHLRLLHDVWGGTGLVAIHHTALRKMRKAGAPYYPWFREEQGNKGDVNFFRKARQLGLKTAVDLSVYAGHLAEVPVGLGHFWEAYSPAYKMAHAHCDPSPITTVAAVIPTLNPVTAATMLEEIKKTAGVPVTGVILADYQKRGGVKAINDAVTAAASTGHDAILLLDDDLFDFKDGWLKRLCDVLSQPNVGAVGPTIACRGPQGKKPEETGVDPSDMHYLVGACCLFKRAAMEDGGPQDEAGYTHYAADVDQCATLKKQGWKLVWVPEVVVGHKIAGTGFYPDLWNKDHDYFARKWGKPREAVADIAPAAPSDALEVALR